MLVINYSYLSPPLSVFCCSCCPCSPSLPLSKEDKGDSAPDSWAYSADLSIYRVKTGERKVYTVEKKND